MTPGRVLQYLDKILNVKAYIPNHETVNQGDKRLSLSDKSNFNFDPSSMTCICPLGEPMRRVSREMRRGVLNIKFKGTTCPTCCARLLCTKSEARQVRMTMADNLVREMNKRMATSFGKRAMALRRQSVEAVFGQLKEHLGFRKFSLRGLWKVKGEFALLCSAINIKKLHKYLNNFGRAGSTTFSRVNSLKSLLFGRIFVHLPRLVVFLTIKIKQPDSMTSIYAIG